MGDLDAEEMSTILEAGENIETAVEFMAAVRRVIGTVRGAQAASRAIRMFQLHPQAASRMILGDAGLLVRSIKRKAGEAYHRFFPEMRDGAVIDAAGGHV